MAALSVVLALMLGFGIGFLAFSPPPPPQHPPTLAPEIARTEPTHTIPHIPSEETSGIALGSDSLDVRELADKIKDMPAIAESARPTQGMIVLQGDTASHPSDLLAAASSAVETKDWQTALTIYDSILAANHTNQDALLGKIFALEQRGSDEDLAALTSLTVTMPRSAAVHAARARLFVKRNEMSDALNAWQRAVECDTKNVSYRLGLAILNDRLGHSEDALRLYREVPPPLPIEAQRRADYLAASLAHNETPTSIALSSEEE